MEWQLQYLMAGEAYKAPMAVWCLYRRKVGDCRELMVGWLQFLLVGVVSKGLMVGWPPFLLAGVVSKELTVEWLPFLLAGVASKELMVGWLPFRRAAEV